MPSKHLVQWTFNYLRSITIINDITTAIAKAMVTVSICQGIFSSTIDLSTTEVTVGVNVLLTTLVMFLYIVTILVIGITEVLVIVIVDVVVDVVVPVTTVVVT